MRLFQHRLMKLLALDHVFSSAGFLLVTALIAASLLVVIGEQARRVRLLWTQPLTPTHFASAPYRAEFERPAGQSTSAPTRIWSERRIGVTGALLFHVGLLCLVVAGALRALFASSAAVDLLESETLAPQAAAWAVQYPGLLARPLALAQPITLRAVESARYASGDLRHLALRLGVAGEERELTINRELRRAGGRLFLGHDFGPAALLEWRQNGATLARERVLLTDSGAGRYEEKTMGPAGMRAYLRAHVTSAGDHPELLEVHVMRNSALVRAEDLHVGQTLALADGVTLTLHGLPFWARLRASHDPALGLAFAGFVLLMLGAIIIFAWVKVDACIVVTPAGDREKVFVALRPQRFSPIFRERFEELLRQQGATA